MNNFLHNVNPTLKLLTLLVSFIGILLVQNLDVLMYYLVVLFSLYIVSTKLTIKQNVVLFLFLGLLFISTATSMTFFGKGTITWFRWGIIHITAESYYHGMFLGIRALVFSFLGILFSLTTPPVQLFYSLMQQLRLKPKYAYSFMAGIRLLSMVVEEFQILKRAIYVRGVRNRWGIGAVFQRFKLYAIPLLAQSIRRAYQVAVAMEAKQFNHSGTRTFYYKIGFTSVDVKFFCFFFIVCQKGCVFYFLRLFNVFVRGCYFFLSNL